MNESHHIRRPRAGGAARRRWRGLGQDARLLLGRQPREFHPRDQHDRHQFRRGAPGLQSSDGIQARHDRSRPGSGRKLGHYRRRQDDHLPPAQGRQVPFAEGLQADPRFQRRRRAVVDRPPVETGPSLFQGVRRQVRLLQRHGHADPPRLGREDRRPHRRDEAQDAERRHSRQSGDGLHGDRVEGIRRLPAQEGNAGAVRSGAGRHRPVLLRRLSEGFGDPLQGEQGLLRREAAGRRPRLRHHARRDRPLRQAEGRRMPRQRLSAPGRPRRDGEGCVPQGDPRPGTQRRLLGVQQPEAPVRQEGGAAGAVDGDRSRRDHQGRLSRRRRKGDDADPADHVVLRRQDRRQSL